MGRFDVFTHTTPLTCPELPYRHLVAVNDQITLQNLQKIDGQLNVGRIGTPRVRNVPPFNTRLTHQAT